MEYVGMLIKRGHFAISGLHAIPQFLIVFSMCVRERERDDDEYEEMILYSVWETGRNKTPEFISKQVIIIKGSKVKASL